MTDIIPLYLYVNLYMGFDYDIFMCIIFILMNYFHDGHIEGIKLHILLI